MPEAANEIGHDRRYRCCRVWENGSATSGAEATETLSESGSFLKVRCKRACKK
jgi:hypothetical protein